MGHMDMKLALYAFIIFFITFCVLAALNGSRANFDQDSSSSELKTNKGYEWARERDIRSHAQCRERWTDENHEPYERSGCSEYVSGIKGLNNLPPIPKHDGWDDGTTTAQCIADEHAYWDPLLQDMLERGEDMAYSARQRDLADELRQCENFDHVRGQVIHVGDEAGQVQSKNETDSNNTQGIARTEQEQQQHDQLQARGIGMSKYEFREYQRKQFDKIEEKTKQRNQESAERLTEYMKTSDPPEISDTSETEPK